MGYEKHSKMDVLSSLLRPCLIAAPGKKLCVADLSNIEGRVLAWLAGEEWKLQAFRDFDAGTGHDLYALAYAKSFGVTPETVMENKATGDGSMRQIGKVQELALGYSGGAGAFSTFAALYGIDLEQLGVLVAEVADPELLQKGRETFKWFRQKGMSTYGLTEQAFAACDAIKRAWRAAHPATVGLWGALEQSFRDAIDNPGYVFPAGRASVVRPTFKSGKPMPWATIIMPSGRRLCYPAPKIEKDGQISYQGVDQYSRKWTTLRTYSGKLVENLTQAVARDVIAHNLPAVQAAGYDGLLTVHDEDITEAPDTDAYSGGALAEIMARVPPWATGLPLAAAGFDTYFYRKD